MFCSFLVLGIKMIEVVMVGSVALDSIQTPFGKAVETLGGSISYASHACSFFAKPGIVAVVGEDFPQKHIKLFEERGIDVSGLKKEMGKTFRWNGKYEFDMNIAETLSTELNVFQSFNPVLPENYRKAKYVFLGNIDPELQLNVLKQMENPELVVSDTMNYWIENKKEKVMEVIKTVDIALMNDAEARMLFNTPNLFKAAKEVLKLDSDYAIIKKGEHGAIMCTASSCFSSPAYPLENVVDPTGAGDSFAGAFIGYLAKTRDLSEGNVRKAMVYGSVVASLNAEGLGMEKFKEVTQEKIEERFNEFKKIVEF
ncbi:MAG: PfkB family carbohydrate kinase [archaeon]